LLQAVSLTPAVYHVSVFREVQVGLRRMAFLLKIWQDLVHDPNDVCSSIIVHLRFELVIIVVWCIQAQALFSACE
jgi:hypothetical protein